MGGAVTPSTRRSPPQTLRRLRIGFVVLWVALLVPIALLMWSAESRLETQRRLRHEVVAERVFDELEREITLMLDRESRRPAYTSLSNTDPDAWSPFVVGYFTDNGTTTVSAEARLDAERSARVRWAVSQWQAAEPATQATPAAPAAAEAETSTKPAPPEPSATAAAPSEPLQQKSSPEILKQLNRSQVPRRQVVPRPKQPAARDPFRDYQNY